MNIFLSPGFRATYTFIILNIRSDSFPFSPSVSVHSFPKRRATESWWKNIKSFGVCVCVLDKPLWGHHVYLDKQENVHTARAEKKWRLRKAYFLKHEFIIPNKHPQNNKEFAWRFSPEGRQRGEGWLGGRIEFVSDKMIFWSPCDSDAR